MRPSIALFATLTTFAGGCGAVTELTDAGAEADAHDVDAATTADAAPVTCDPADPFDAPTLVPGLAGAFTPSFTDDELVAYFHDSGADLRTARRSSTTQPFGEHLALAITDPTTLEYEPAISADGLELWFHTNVDGINRLFVATRTSRLAEFSDPALVSGINPAAPFAQVASATPIGDELYFMRMDDSTNYDLWSARRTGGAFGAGTVLEAVSSAGHDVEPTVSVDGLTLYLGRAGSIYRSDRTSTDDAWSAPVLVTELEGVWDLGWLSPDRCRLYLSDSATGDVYVAVRQP